MDLHRRIRRSLRFIEAAHGRCWTAPCSPADFAFGQLASRQPEAPAIHDACDARVQSWRDAPRLPSVSKVSDSREPEGQHADNYPSCPF